MPRIGSFTGFLAVALLASPALAQDSTSALQGLPGDAVNAYATGEQINTYVVDLQSFTSSWGTQFGVAPILKASKDSASAFFTNLTSAQAASNTLLTNQPFAFSSYSLWTGPGLGVNDNVTLNGAGSPQNTSGLMGNQFGVLMSEFGGASNHVIGGLVNYDPANPTRLYVARIMAAVNGDSGTCNLAQVGVGSVDANGNAYYRADNFGTAACGGRSPVVNANYYRTRMQARSGGALNILSSTGGSDVTDRLINGTATAHNVPNCIPADAGGPLLLGSNFNNQYVRGIDPNMMTSDSAHFDGAVTDQRGNVGYTHYNFSFLSSTAGVAGLLAKVGGSGSDTDTLNIWGLGAGGAVTGTLALTLPSSGAIVDNCNGFDPAGLGPGRNVFTHAGSQTAFRGASQVALGVDQAGNLLAAATVAYPTFGSDANPLNYIAVARTTPGGTTDWTIAAYSDNGSGITGKPILDGPGGTTVGWLTPLYNVTGGTPLGPSISSPMMDSVGNIYFLSGVELIRPVQNDVDTALVRAVYNASTFCYELELVFDVGTVFHGRNSNRDYQVRFMEVADSNSVSSGSVFSSNIIQSAHRGIDPSNLATRCADTLGGLVVAAEIVYDVDQDGMFDKVTGANGDPNSLDQEYRVLLYIGSTSATPGPGETCRQGNINGGVGPVTDVLFVNGFAGCDPDRIVRVTPTTPFTLSMIAAPSGGRRYAMYVWVGAPNAGTVRVNPQGLGTSCFPTPISGGSPQPRPQKANNIGFTAQLGVENWPGPPTQPAPYNLLNLAGGLNRTGSFFFQGFELDANAPNARAGITNGILVISQ